MRAATWWGASALVLAACVLGANAGDKKDKFDAAKLVGVWTYVSGEKNGEKIDKSHFNDSKVTVTKDTITLEGPSGKFVIKYTLDTAKSPVTVAMEMTESPFGAGAKAKGIVEVKGDELKLCYAAMGDAPTKFATKADSHHHLFVLKRSKK